MSIADRSINRHKAHSLSIRGANGAIGVYTNWTLAPSVLCSASAYIWSQQHKNMVYLTFAVQSASELVA